MFDKELAKKYIVGLPRNSKLKSGIFDLKEDLEKAEDLTVLSISELSDTLHIMGFGNVLVETELTLEELQKAFPGTIIEEVE